MEVGTRVMAVMSSENGVAYVFGSGIYLGDKVPNDDVLIMGIPFADLKDQLGDFRNPAILLDNGQVVFGCECWWGSEGSMKDSIKGLKIEEVDIAKSRRRIMDKVVEEQN